MAREAVEAAAARQAHEQGLGLVVARVGGEQQADAVAAHEVAHQAIARRARGGLDAGRRLGPCQTSVAWR